MTSPNYSYESPVGPWPALVNTADVVNPGDLLYWDSVSATFRPLGITGTVSANSQYFAGVSAGSYPVTSNLDNGQVTPPTTVPMYMTGLQSGQYSTNGDTLHFGDALYATTDAQHLTNTAGTYIVGYYWPDPNTVSLPLAATGNEQLQWRPLVLWPASGFNK